MLAVHIFLSDTSLELSRLFRTASYCPWLQSISLQYWHCSEVQTQWRSKIKYLQYFILKYFTGSVRNMCNGCCGSFFWISEFLAPVDLFQYDRILFWNFLLALVCVSAFFECIMYCPLSMFLNKFALWSLSGALGTVMLKGCSSVSF